jgi:hypothetical protein
MDVAAFAREEAQLQESVLKLCPANLWHNGSYASGCPRPVLVGEHHQQQMQDLHEALTAAITDIVQRWWSDTEARFPERMPLEAREEELLRVSTTAGGSKKNRDLVKGIIKVRIIYPSL